MKRNYVAAVCVLCLTALVRADYPADRAAAVALVNAGKHELALDAFTKLAQAAGSDYQKSDALEMAALSAHRLKRGDLALSLAKSIPITSYATMVQMRLLLDSGKHEELLSRFGKVDMTDWPDEIAGRASYYRGFSNVRREQGAAAELDLTRAVKLLGTGAEERGIAALTLAENYKNILQEPQRALDAYLAVQQMQKPVSPFGWVYLDSIVSAAGILREQGKFDEAKAMLDSANLSATMTVWRCNFLIAYARLADARGDRSEGIARLREVLAWKELPAWQRDEATRLMTELGGTP
jgi:tetratricopeptide (TPR) repeat protein